jgi:hypothetical protein
MAGTAHRRRHRIVRPGGAVFVSSLFPGILPVAIDHSVSAHAAAAVREAATPSACRHDYQRALSKTRLAERSVRNRQRRLIESTMSPMRMPMPAT